MKKKLLIIAIVLGLVITGLTYFITHVPSNPDDPESLGTQMLVMKYNWGYLMSIQTIPAEEVALYQAAHPYQLSGAGFPFVYYIINFDATSHIIYDYLAFSVDFLIYFVICFIIIFILDRQKGKRYAEYQHRSAMMRYNRRKKTKKK